MHWKQLAAEITLNSVNEINQRKTDKHSPLTQLFLIHCKKQTT